MVEHIELWYMRVGKHRFEALQTLAKFRKLPFCENPNLDIKYNKKFQLYLFFWKTDREDVNCLRCLAMLNKVENEMIKA